MSNLFKFQNPYHPGAVPQSWQFQADREELRTKERYERLYHDLGDLIDRGREILGRDLPFEWTEL